jgi:hypothetical protein
VRLDHLLSKEFSPILTGPLPLAVGHSAGATGGNSQLVHWLLDPDPVTTVADLGLPPWCARGRRPLFRFEGVPAWAPFRRRTALELGSGGVARLVVEPPPLENCIASTSIFVLPSYKGPTVDALAPTTDEGRGRLRKATGRCLPTFDPWMSEWGNPAPVMGCHSGLNT